jgi:two-component system chemotaxis sensor kinase CheA
MGVVSELEQEFEYEIVDEFIGHYQLMISVMEGCIMSLEDEDKYKKNVEELFRIFHNIKSATGFLKLDPIIKLSSLVEQILEEARSVPGPASKELIHWLLLVNDQFDKWLSDFLTDKPKLHTINVKILRLPIIEE